MQYIYFFPFFNYFFLLYNIVLVLPYINMHPPQVYTCSPCIFFISVYLALFPQLYVEIHAYFHWYIVFHRVIIP